MTVHYAMRKQNIDSRLLDMIEDRKTSKTGAEMVDISPCILNHCIRSYLDGYISYEEALVTAILEISKLFKAVNEAFHQTLIHSPVQIQIVGHQLHKKGNPMSINFTPAEAAESIANVLKKAIEAGEIKQVETLEVNGRTMFDHFKLLARCADCDKSLTFRDEYDGELVWDNSEYWQTGHKTPYCRECYSRRFGDSDVLD